jgi:hypothetical protein
MVVWVAGYQAIGGWRVAVVSIRIHPSNCSWKRDDVQLRACALKVSFLRTFILLTNRSNGAKFAKV